MTKIIFTGLLKNQFSLIKFYSARARRITPALLTACCFVLIFGWFYISHQDFITLAKHVGSSIFFFSNFIYWSESGYFDVASKSKLLLHTWSLSVEWQFYLIFPFIIMASIAVAGKNFARFVILGLTLLSFAFCVYSSFRWPGASYFLLPSRSWEMLAGGLVFLFPFNSSLPVRKTIHYLGLSLIIIAYFIFDESKVWPGYLSFIPVFGAMLLISAKLDDDLTLRNTYIQRIGLWSYSIYLWHWIILSVIYFFNPFYDVYAAIGGIAVSIIAGYLSYSYVEIRGELSLSWKCYAPLTIISLLVIANTNVMQKVRNLTAQYDTQDWVSIYKDFKDSDMGGDYWIPCAAGWQMAKNNTTSVATKCIENKGSGGVFVLGDSHAAAIAVGIRRILKDGVPYNQLASPGCVVNWEKKPAGMGNKNFSEGCDFQNQLSEQAIREIKPSVVIVIRALRHELGHFENLAAKMKSAGVQKFIILGPVPQWLPSLPVALSKPKRVIGDYIITNATRSDIFQTNDIIKQKYNSLESIIFGDVLGSFCHPVGDNIACRYRVDDKNLMTFDYGHPTEMGADLIAKTVIKPLLPKSMVKP